MASFRGRPKRTWRFCRQVLSSYVRTLGAQVLPWTLQVQVLPTCALIYAVGCSFLLQQLRDGGQHTVPRCPERNKSRAALWSYRKTHQTKAPANFEGLVQYRGLSLELGTTGARLSRARQLIKLIRCCLAHSRITTAEGTVPREVFSDK